MHNRKISLIVIAAAAVFCTIPLVVADVMLQWFETEWDEMYRKIPLVAEIGYDYIWAPPPTKAPTGLGTKWGNVGYNLYDRFDVGDIPQRGSYATRYGSRGSLVNMVKNMHQCDVKVIPDIIMNHNGNGPDIRYYPGMRVEDFHVQWESGHCNTLNYKRGPRMTQWYHGEGYGGTMWEDLCSLIDIRTEDHPLNSVPKRFTGGSNTPGWNFVDGVSYLRHRGRYDKYPYYPSGYVNENAAELLYRWIAWLGNTIDYDGLRLDAGKHTPYEFFGWKNAGFLHEAQYNFALRRGFPDTAQGWPNDCFNNYILRTNAVIFAEILSPWSEINYWFKDGTANPMRFLDYQIKQTANSALEGSIGNFYGYGTDFGPNNGIMYVWGHDEGPKSKVNLGYAYTLTHIGFPMVYYTGNNILWSDKGTKTWMIPGYDEQALGEDYNDVANAVYVHQCFARGSENNLWHDGDVLALERYDSAASGNQGLLIAALNDSGGDQTKTFSGLHFSNGTVLHDYTGHNASDVTVSGGSVTMTIPGNSGQGWVFYAPRNADGNGTKSLMFKQNGSECGTITWVVPGGVNQASQTKYIPRITGTNVSVDVFFNPLGGAVDYVALKWGQGLTRLNTNYWHKADKDAFIGNHQSCVSRNSTNWFFDFQINSTNVPEGLNLVKARVFNQRPAGDSAIFNTFTKVVYVDRRGPELNITYPAAGSTVNGDCVMIIENPDFTAYNITYNIDGGAETQVREVYKGLWKAVVPAQSAGAHTINITATEADWAASRAIINTSAYSRAYTAAANPQSITISRSADETIYQTFFNTAVTAPGATDVKLYWNGFEVPFNGGLYTNTFNGEVVYRDATGSETDRLWGAFVNGANFFEATRVDAGVTSRVARHVTFNLYGINAIDSDGDSLPDNVEMPYIDTDGAPGADAPWPGDNNKDFIPNYGETWTKLNPYNHATYYSSQWDDSQDFDGDGYSNGEEVRLGYEWAANIYRFNIYDRNSYPTGSSPVVGSAADWAPEYAVRGQDLTINYMQRDGVLSAANPVVLHVGHSKKTALSWQEVTSVTMTAVSSTNWHGTYHVPTNATSVDFCFRDSGSVIWDGNNGRDWQANIQGVTSSTFNIDGEFDSANYVVYGSDMVIHAAVNNGTLYVATWGTAAAGDGNDHFLYVTDELGDAVDPAPGWHKSGYAFFNTSAKPFITAEGNNDFACWNNGSGPIKDGGNGKALEGTVNLLDTFGYIPDAVYVASIAYGGADYTGILSQGPAVWNADNNIDPMEFLRVPINSVKDEDMDGYFDGGKPQMWTVVNGATNDANYGLLRFFVNELNNNNPQNITVIVKPNANPGDTVSDVELFSNLNRRDFATLPGDEDPDTVTTDSASSYYRAYPMTSIGGGMYSVTVPVTHCGAYRLNARFKVNGGAYYYYTDNGLRRDCAVVVSPTKALDAVMYELNPMMAEAKDDTFFGRSTFKNMYQVDTDRFDAISTNRMPQLGVNMLWLQPIHPIGTENKQIDPSTVQPYDPGSPYAVRNYWQVNSVLGDPSSPTNAMREFSDFVQAMDGVNVGVMLDGTFNHSAWDCEVGDVGTNFFNWATNANTLIRDIRPQWYSKKDYYDQPATYYGSEQLKDIATAPDRIDFGKWTDAADFFFGSYDALVKRAPADTNWAWSSQWYSRYLFEEDAFGGFATNATRELWEYFAYYPQYWLEKTGHPVGTPKAESYHGIDGLRCDFAQGLPSTFWEYTINKTRGIKWDFLFMAESLDGYRTVAGTKHHGVGYRSARHFDILNENLVFFWRDTFFNKYNGGSTNSGTASRTTPLIKEQFDNRKDAFAQVPILLNLTCHDEVNPTPNQASMMYAQATLGAMAGAPMLFYGQEAGAQNDYATYNKGGDIDRKNNFVRYEVNFGKSIPNFKRYNCMTQIWAQGSAWMGGLRDTYGRLNWARQRSPALRSQNDYFLSKTTGGYDDDMFAVAKYEAAGMSAASQDVVFAFVNNNMEANTNRASLFSVNADYQGRNWFGIESGHSYNIVDLASPTPTNYLWTPNKSGASLIADGLYVGLNQPPWQGGQVQYLKLIDVAATYPHTGSGQYNGSDYSDWDWDSDGMNNRWEIEHGLDPRSALGTNGPAFDNDGDGMPNGNELMAGTDPNNRNSMLAVNIDRSAGQMSLAWAGVTNINYAIQRRDSLTRGDWTEVYRGTALTPAQNFTDWTTGNATSRYYRGRVVP